MIEKNSNIHLLKQLAVAWFLPLLICLNLPADIYLANVEEMYFPLSNALGIPALFFIAAGSTLSLLLFLPFTAVRQFLLRLLIALSVIAWVESSFLVGDYGMFNGETLSIPDRGALAYLELALCIGLIITVQRVKKFGEIGSDVVAALFVLSLALFAYKLFQGAPENPIRDMSADYSFENMDDEEFERFARFSNKSNILHILLDELQIGVLQKLLTEEPGLKETLDGFTLFPNTSSVFPYTVMSLPAILSGEVYRQGSISAYLDKSMNDNDFFRALHTEDYQALFHIHPRFCNSKYQVDCQPIPAISIRPTSLNLIDLSLFRSVPLVLKSKVYDRGSGIITAIMATQGLRDTTTGIGLLLLKQFNQRFSVADIPPTYKFFHSMATHAPLVLQRDCGADRSPNPNNMRSMQVQASCAFAEVTKLLAQLKAADIYDRTLIVISSDHGGNYFSPGQSKALKQRNIQPQHFARGQSTLMIKPFTSRGALRQSTLPATLSDIARTVSYLAKLNYAPAGENLYDEKFPRDRVRNFYFAEWNFNTAQNDYLEGVIPYRIKGDVRRVGAWQKAEQ